MENSGFFGPSTAADPEPRPSAGLTAGTVSDRTPPPAQRHCACWVFAAKLAPTPAQPGLLCCLSVSGYRFAFKRNKHRWDVPLGSPRIELDRRRGHLAGCIVEPAQPRHDFRPDSQGGATGVRHSMGRLARTRGELAR